jgi:hypothetical protein
MPHGPEWACRDRVPPEGRRASLQGRIHGMYRQKPIRDEFSLCDVNYFERSYYGEMIWVLMMLEQWLESHSTPTSG